MPTMWFAKDGKRPDTQSGPGIPITTQEIQTVFGMYQIIYKGKEAPSINPEHPSHSKKNIVIEVELSNEISSLIPEIGFYVVLGLSPTEADYQLNTHRNAA